jgi:hypothetical protein
MLGQWKAASDIARRYALALVEKPIWGGHRGD